MQYIGICPKFGYFNAVPNYYPAAQCISRGKLALMNHIRMLWEQHVMWTRLVILSIVFDLPDVDLVTSRLLRNPIDFENVLKIYYGETGAARFAELFKSHLVIAAQLVKAAKAGDNQAATDAEKKWYANADEIAAFLGRINPYWSQADWRKMLYEHLALTKTEAVDMLNKDYSASIATYDKIERQALAMADMMAAGIIMQFSDAFK